VTILVSVLKGMHYFLLQQAKCFESIFWAFEAIPNSVASTSPNISQRVSGGKSLIHSNPVFRRLLSTRHIYIFGALSRLTRI